MANLETIFRLPVILAHSSSALFSSLGHAHALLNADCLTALQVRPASLHPPNLAVTPTHPKCLERDEGLGGKIQKMHVYVIKPSNVATDY